jgi:phage-related protein
MPTVIAMIPARMGSQRPKHKNLRELAAAEGAGFRQRSEALGNNQASSEQYVAAFLEQWSGVTG